MFCPIRKEGDDTKCEDCAMYIISSKDGEWEGCAFVRMALDISHSQGVKMESGEFGKR
ncbi:hypothetical protein FACS1894137_13480 [Spirochaetia bacterium]|nr:hypothetical protein FACS1894137_13480 [Spirochaetia bacterium]